MQLDAAAGAIATMLPFSGAQPEPRGTRACLEACGAWLQESLDADPAGLAALQRVARGLARLDETDAAHRAELAACDELAAAAARAVEEEGSLRASRVQLRRREAAAA